MAIGTTPDPGSRSWARALLRVPLFYKLLLANAAIVLVGATAGTAFTAALVRARPDRPLGELVLGLSLIGVGLSLLVNAVLLRIALGPVRALETTVARIQAGAEGARVPPSLVADADLERLILAFNDMLDQLTLARNRSRDTARRALEAQEEERKRIARELHDDTAQALAALRVRLEVARRQPDPDQRDRELEQIRTALGEALEGIRRFARGLRPAALEDAGLAAALQAHIRWVGETTTVPIAVELADVRGLLTPEVELALYRILQEAIANAVRHAGAGRITLRLRREGGRVRALVADDGRGFDPGEVLSGGGLGLFGLRERASYVGGTVEIISRPGAGTRIQVTVPLAEDSGA